MLESILLLAFIINTKWSFFAFSFLELITVNYTSNLQLVKPIKFLLRYEVITHVKVIHVNNIYLFSMYEYFRNTKMHVHNYTYLLF